MKNLNYLLKSFAVQLFFCFILFETAQAQLVPITWDSITVKSSQVSSGFLDIIDIDNDGKLEIIHSTLMESGSAANQASTKGAVRIFNASTTTGYPTSWTETIVLPTDSNLPFINTPQVFDVNEDGHLDILVQEGFLQTNGGSHQWLKGPLFNSMYAFTPATEKGNTDYFWHESCQFDLDGDGKKDIITTCADNSVSPVAKKIEWYRHLGNGLFTKYTINDSLGGVFIKIYDVDSDSDMDIVVSQFFGPPAKPSIVWLEQVNAPSVSNSWAGTWNYHIIDKTTGLGYYFEFFDINNDGNTELVYGNHNNLNNNNLVDGNGNPIQSGLYYFDIPSNPASSNQWTKHLISENFPCDLFDFGNPASQGSPGIWTIGDIDNNGLSDIVMPGDGMSGLFLIRQKNDHSFVKETITSGRMWGMAKIMDYDNNGVNEIVGSLHNYPANFLEALFGMPAGKLMIFKPSNITLEEKENTNLESSFSIYPNPVKESLIIKINSDVTVDQIKILNLIGSVVYEAKAYTENNEICIDMRDLSVGTYLVQITTGEGFACKRIIKF